MEITLLAALVLGLAPFLQRSDVFIVVAIAGGVILLWMGLGMFRALPTLTLSLKAGKSKSGSLIKNGAILSIANPYWIVWWATIGFGYVIYSWRFGIAGLIFFSRDIFSQTLSGIQRFLRRWGRAGIFSPMVFTDG